MAWVITKLHSEQFLSIGVEPAECTLVTQFLIAQNTPSYNGTGEDVWNVWKSIQAENVPFNAIYGIGKRLSTSAVDAGLAQMIVTDLRVTPAPNRPNTYLVTQTAKAPILGESPYAGLKISTQTQNRTVAQYIRPSSASFPADFDVTWPSATLIAGGTVTNVMGNPIQYQISQDVVRIEYLEHEAATIRYTNYPANPAQYVNRRNSQQWLGFSSGALLFSAYEQRYVSDQVKMNVLTFINDPWGHLEQVSLRNPVDGSVWNDSTQSLGGSTIKVTGRAVWFQPYELKGAFHQAGNVLPTEILNQLTTVEPAWV